MLVCKKVSVYVTVSSSGPKMAASASSRGSGRALACVGRSLPGFGVETRGSGRVRVGACGAFGVCCWSAGLVLCGTVFKEKLMFAPCMHIMQEILLKTFTGLVALGPWLAGAAVFFTCELAGGGRAVCRRGIGDGSEVLHGGAAVIFTCELAGGSRVVCGRGIGDGFEVLQGQGRGTSSENSWRTGLLGFVGLGVFEVVCVSSFLEAVLNL